MPLHLRSQAEVCDRFYPLLKAGKVYRKSASSFIRKALKGEQIVTTLHGLEETKQTVKDDTSWVVCSRAAGEEYVITDREFRSNYEESSAKAIDPRSPFHLAARLRQQGYLEYRPKRRIQTHKVDGEDMRFFHGHSTASSEAAQFIAPWGEPMRVELGDYLAMTYPEAEMIEIYRIEPSAFGCTYTECGTETKACDLNLRMYMAGFVGALLAFTAYYFYFFRDAK